MSELANFPIGGIFFCPNCNVEFTVNPMVSDFVHACNSGNETIDNEDVVVIGNWEDYTGSGTVAPNHTSTAGIQNRIAGTRAAIKGSRVFDITSRGANINTHRTRQKLVYARLDALKKQKAEETNEDILRAAIGTARQPEDGQ